MTRTIPKAIQSAINRRKSPGQIAYEKDVRKTPTYHDGSHRRDWNKLCEVAQWSWSRKTKET